MCNKLQHPEQSVVLVFYSLPNRMSQQIHGPMDLFYAFLLSVLFTFSFNSLIVLDFDFNY